MFRSLFSWITLLGESKPFGCTSPCWCFDPCFRGSRSSGLHFTASVKSADELFRSLFSWITLLGRFSRNFQRFLPDGVSILVFVDHAPRVSGFPVGPVKPTSVSILVFVDHAPRVSPASTCKLTSNGFRSLFSWITLLGVQRSDGLHGRVLVSILVFVDHAPRANSPTQGAKR